MTLNLRIGKYTDVGHYRENNEDKVEVKQLLTAQGDPFTVCIVADGMGGQAAGETASRIATETIPRELQNSLAGVQSEEDIYEALRSAAMTANREIISMGDLDRDFRNMGTTIVVSLWMRSLREDHLYLASLGDSRAYRLRGGELEQLTTDHSIAQALVEAKTISASEARSHRFRNILWKFLGSREMGENGPDVRTVDLQPGDVFLLCTDGVSGVLSDEDMKHILASEPDPDLCAQRLCQQALEAGSRDNVTSLVIAVEQS